jgi:transposase
MLRKEDFAVIKALQRRDVYIKDIAADLGVHPKTVSRALKRGSAPSMVRRRRASKLDPFKATVDRLLSEGVWNTMVFLREIQAEGYTGGSTMLRLYVQPKRALRPSRATVRFACPGGLGQGD